MVNRFGYVEMGGVVRGEEVVVAGGFPRFRVRCADCEVSVSGGILGL